MDYRPLVEGRKANFGIYRNLVFKFWMTFSVKKKTGFRGLLGPPYSGVGATIRNGQEMLCLLYAGFF